MHIEIKNRFNGNIIIVGEYASIRDALEENYRADLSCADLSWAGLSGADLSSADLSSADLSCADLSCADLSSADLSWANLSCANLSGAYGIILPIISICGSMHLFTYIEGDITIGCEFHSLEYWKIMYDFIGKENEYTDAQIA